MTENAIPHPAPVDEARLQADLALLVAALGAGPGDRNDAGRRRGRNGHATEVYPTVRGTRLASPPEDDVQ